VPVALNQYHKSKEELAKELEQVEAAKADPARFGVLYDKYYKPIFVFIYRRTENEELTADLTSMVFMKAMMNIKKFEYRGVPFSAWLFRIALNEINMYFRKSNAERVISLEKADISIIIDDIESDNTEENRAILMSAMGHLPGDAVQLIELRFFEKRSFSEVGDILGITENNAKVKVYRILDKLKSLILAQRKK
jgi:RNA polymerase sigma-70 factor (ECF subfamily)